MKVIVEFTNERKQEHKFDAKEQMITFVEYCSIAQTMHGGIRKITIVY